MFVEEGFRIRFGNGEVIDFYADSAPEKEGWMNVLSETVGRGYAAGAGQPKAWTQLVLRRQRSFQAKNGSNNNSSAAAPTLAASQPSSPRKPVSTPSTMSPWPPANSNGFSASQNTTSRKPVPASSAPVSQSLMTSTAAVTEPERGPSRRPLSTFSAIRHPSPVRRHQHRASQSAIPAVQQPRHAKTRSMAL